MKCWQKNSKKTNKITVISNRKNSDLKGSGHCFSVKIKFALVIFSVYAIIINCYGVWRSLVARTAGGREVAGSNPVAPILFFSRQFLPFFRNTILHNRTISIALLLQKRGRNKIKYASRILRCIAYQ